MRILWSLMAATFLFSCSEGAKSHRFSSVRVETVYEDSISIRAIEFLDSRTLAFAGSNGMYGTVDVTTHAVRSNIQQYDTIIPHFRAVGHTSTDFFMLSISNPALLYKTGNDGQMELVYFEEGEGVFYDSLKFWNDREGMAVGDSVNGCLSILITRDGGNTWHKTPCSELPKGLEGEGAFAASNTNIGMHGDRAWIATTPQTGEKRGLPRLPPLYREPRRKEYIPWIFLMPIWGLPLGAIIPSLKPIQPIKW